MSLPWDWRRWLWRVTAEAITELTKWALLFFLSEQNAQIALMITRHGYVLENGRLVLDGLSKDLIHNEKVKKAYLGTYQNHYI